jgi:hypothetical protein
MQGTTRQNGLSAKFTGVPAPLFNPTENIARLARFFTIFALRGDDVALRFFLGQPATHPEALCRTHRLGFTSKFQLV